MAKKPTWKEGEENKLIQVTLQHNVLTIYPLAKDKRAVKNYWTGILVLLLTLIPVSFSEVTWYVFK